MRSPEANLKGWKRIGCVSGLIITTLVIFVGLAIDNFRQQLPRSEPLLPASTTAHTEELQPVEQFASIVDPAARSVALFREAGKVITHPRCLNCHPRSDTPTQTNVMRPHIPAVSRGPDGRGSPTLRCSTCHHQANYPAAMVPGNPKWSLAPIEMAWQGKTLGQICRQIKDPTRGGMPPAELLHHMAHDELVGWAWHPGGRRAPAPGSQVQFGQLIEAWLQTGGKCPA